MHDHNAFNGNNDNNGLRARRLKLARIREGNPSTSLPPQAYQHAERLDMQLDPTCLGERRKSGESSSIRHIDRKAGNECSSSSSSVGLFTVRERKEGRAAPSICRRERGERLIVLVSEKEGNYILSVAA